MPSGKADRRIGNETESYFGPVLEDTGERRCAGNPVCGVPYTGQAPDPGRVRHGGNYYDIHNHCQCDRPERFQYGACSEQEGGCGGFLVGVLFQSRGGLRHVRASLGGGPADCGVLRYRTTEADRQDSGTCAVSRGGHIGADGLGLQTDGVQGPVFIYFCGFRHIRRRQRIHGLQGNGSVGHGGTAAVLLYFPDAGAVCRGVLEAGFFICVGQYPPAFRVRVETSGGVSYRYLV